MISGSSFADVLSRSLSLSVVLDKTSSDGSSVLSSVTPTVTFELTNPTDEANKPSTLNASSSSSRSGSKRLWVSTGVLDDESASELEELLSDWFSDSWD